MATRVMIRNVEPVTKMAGAAADITVRVTGGGKPQTQVLTSGEEAEFEISENSKLQVSEGGGE